MCGQSLLHESVGRLKLGDASLESRDVVEFALAGLSSSKRIASSLDGDFVVGIDFNWRQRTLASAAVDTRS